MQLKKMTFQGGITTMIQVSEAAFEKIVEILSSANALNSFLRIGVDEGDAVVYPILLSWMSRKQKVISY